MTFSEGVSSVEIPIEIVNDNEFENAIETFTVSLSTEVPRLVLLNEAVVTIRDDDSKAAHECVYLAIALCGQTMILTDQTSIGITIGFNSTSYTATENTGTLLIAVDFLQGSISEDTTAQVLFATTPGQAMPDGE